MITVELINSVIRAEYLVMFEVRKGLMVVMVNHYKYLAKDLGKCPRAEVGKTTLPDGRYYLTEKIKDLKQITKFKV
jgi:hypothetical protein